MEARRFEGWEALEEEQAGARTVVTAAVLAGGARTRETDPVAP